MILQDGKQVPHMHCAHCDALVNNHSTRTHNQWQAGTLSLAANHPLVLAQAATQCLPAPDRPAPVRPAPVNPGAPLVPAAAQQATSPTITLSARVVCQKIDDIERTSTDPTVAAMLPTLRELLGLK